MSQLYVTPALLGVGPGNTSFLAAVQDANNHVAVGMTKFVQTPSGILLPEITDSGGYVQSKTVGSNVLVGTYNVTFAASAAANTTETASVALPTTLQKDALYLVSVNNPTGLGTSVTVTFRNAIGFGGSNVFITVDSVDIASGALQGYLVQGWLLGDGAAQISVTNDVAASASGGTVQFEVTRI